MVPGGMLDIYSRCLASPRCVLASRSSRVGRYLSRLIRVSPWRLKGANRVRGAPYAARHTPAYRWPSLHQKISYDWARFMSGEVKI